MSKKKQKQQEKRQKNILPTLEGLNQEFMEFFNSFAKKSDRDTALSCCAFLDDTLNAMFRKMFVDEEKFIDENVMKGTNSPLGSFSARINMAYALGWIGPKMRESLHSIRDIRNGFAHHYKLDRFEHPDFTKAFATLRANTIFKIGDSERSLFWEASLLLSQQLAVKACELKRVPQGWDFTEGSRTVL
jgi:DNA-binding MltR family transcriptional regulator